MILSILRSILDFAPPLILAALGGVISERAGVVNIGLEGMMRVGAFFACWAAFASGSAWAGVLAGLAAGAALAAVHAFVSIHGRADQVVSGIALNLVALAAILRSTVPGLRLRAVGEHPHAAATLGVSVAKVRWAAVLASGALAGLGGSALSLAILHRFDNKMPAGMGFMALAAMVFGKWSPLGAFGASVFFAFGNAVVDVARSAGTSGGALADLHLDGILLAAPYLLTLALLAGFVGRAQAPAADGIPFDPEAKH